MKRSRHHVKHLYVSTPVKTFHKNDKWQFLVFNYNDAVTQRINTCTQQMLLCCYNHVCLHGIFAYENINVMMFKCIFGHYANKRFVERFPQFHAEYKYDTCITCFVLTQPNLPPHSSFYPGKHCQKVKPVKMSSWH